MALEVSYTGSGVLPVNTALIGPIDADGLQGLSMQVTSMGTSGSVTLVQSNDGITWTNTLMQVVAGSNVTAMGGTGILWTNLVGRYFKVVINSATTGGTTSIKVRVSPEQYSSITSMISVGVLSIPAIPAGTNLIGSVQANMTATAGNGVNWSIHRLLVSAATTNATSVKATGGRIGQIRGYNGAAASKFLKLYNKATAPTVGTDVPVLTFVLKANSEFVIDVSDLGICFSVGIAYALTGSVSDADTTAIAANDIVGLNILYI